MVKPVRQLLLKMLKDGLISKEEFSAIIRYLLAKYEPPIANLLKETEPDPDRQLVPWEYFKQVEEVGGDSHV